MQLFAVTMSRTVFCLICLGLSAFNCQAAIDPGLLEGLSARSLGPAAVSGRITAVDVVSSDQNHIVIGAATGGVWISENGGLNWTPVFDEQAVASIGAVAINQSNPDVIWVGTGEGNTRNSTSIGGGMFKSIDGGKHWKRIGLENTERINRIALHPDNPDIAYAAALGTLWGENEDRGIYKTTDGGESWERILYLDSKSGGTDIKIDPFNPDKLYASLWQHRRWPYFFKSGGPGSGMYISWDGGDNWKHKTEEDGLPEGELGRITFSPSPALAGRVYALVEAEKSAMMRSDDGGESWIRTNEDFDIAIRPFYYTEVAADPENPDRVYNIFNRLSVSIDGGRTFELNPVIDCCAASNTIHIDNHALWINPADPRHLIIGNDGGIAISQDRGETWRYVRNLPLSQFYHIAVDNDHPYHIYGGLQDNGSWRGPSEVWENAGIRNLHWQEVYFGDGFDTLPDPENSRRGYAMSQGGHLSVWNLDTGERRQIRPAPHAAGVDLRFNWNAGLAQDPFDAATIYYGSQYLHKSTDRGATWTVISGDLTTNNPGMQTFRESGGLTPDVTDAETYTSIVAVAPSPLEQGTIWVGTDDGRVQLTRDGGKNWQRLDERARGAPAGAWVPMIHPSPHDAGTAFVVFDDHRRSDMQPYVYRVENYGKDWHSLVTDELSGYALSVLQDPENPDLLFLGTEFGLYFSLDAGRHWIRFSAGVPTVSVMDMAIQSRETDLVLGTHGRSIYVLDDYSALRNLSESDFRERLKILSVTPGQKYRAGQTPSTRFTGSGEFRAENEPYGVMVTFVAGGEDLPHPDEDVERELSIKRRLSSPPVTTRNEDGKDDKKPKVIMTVKNDQGEIIRTQKFPVHRGVNRLVWSMKHDGVRPMPGLKPRKLEDGLPDGPEVPAGEYQISLRLEAGESDPAEQFATATVLSDPRSDAGQEEQRRVYRTLLALLELRESTVTAVERIVAARADVDTVLKLIDVQAEGQPPGQQEDSSVRELKKMAKEVKTGLDGIEKRFRAHPETRGITYNDDKISNMIGMAQSYVNSSANAPTATAETYMELARQALDQGLDALDQFMNEDLAQFIQAVDAAGIGLFKTATATDQG
jgi:photosystem II stability/assembly factor-like uncharacterized protein